MIWIKDLYVCSLVAFLISCVETKATESDTPVTPAELENAPLFDDPKTFEKFIHEKDDSGWNSFRLNGAYLGWDAYIRRETKSDLSTQGYYFCIKGKNEEFVNHEDKGPAEIIARLRTLPIGSKVLVYPINVGFVGAGSPSHAGFYIDSFDEVVKERKFKVILSNYDHLGKPTEFTISKPKE